DLEPLAETLREDGTPIRNLFCGGGVAVGISGNGCRGYSPGNGLLTAVGWGRVAGGTAAAQIQAEEGTLRPVTRGAPGPAGWWPPIRKWYPRTAGCPSS